MKLSLTRAAAVPAVLSCLALGALGASSPASATPASAAKTCSAPANYPGSGYFTSLKVSGVGCSTGRAVTLAHYRCRVKHGRAGKCGTKVLHYSCSEKRNGIATEFDSRVTCRRGSRSVVYTYQQNL